MLLDFMSFIIPWCLFGAIYFSNFPHIPIMDSFHWLMHSFIPLCMHIMPWLPLGHIWQSIYGGNLGLQFFNWFNSSFVPFIHSTCCLILVALVPNFWFHSKPFMVFFSFTFFTDFTNVPTTRIIKRSLLLRILLLMTPWSMDQHQLLSWMVTQGMDPLRSMGTVGMVIPWSMDQLLLHDHHTMVITLMDVSIIHLHPHHLIVLLNPNWRMEKLCRKNQSSFWNHQSNNHEIIFWKMCFLHTFTIVLKAQSLEVSKYQKSKVSKYQQLKVSTSDTFSLILKPERWNFDEKVVSFDSVVSWAKEDKHTRFKIEFLNQKISSKK